MAKNETPNMAYRSPSVGVDIAYALINLGGSTLWSILSWWLSYFYLPPEGTTRVPVALFGVVMFIAGALNAIIALPIGYISDHLHTRWGRRLPLMFGAALPMLILFILLWTPPVPGESIKNLIYLALILILYNFFYSLNQIPYTALLPELARTDQHRVRISAWASSFLLFGTIISGFAGMVIEKYGYMIMALSYAAGSLPAFYLPFLILHEPPQSPVAMTLRPNFHETGRVLLNNRPFLIMTVTGLCYWGITTLVMSAIPYLATEICLLSQVDTWAFYIPAVLATLLCYPLVMWLANHFGKWYVFAGSLLASALVLPGSMLIGDGLPLPLKTQGILWVTLQAVTLSGITMLPPTFGAEIVDYDAKMTGQRREGLYYGIWGLLGQTTNGLAAAVWSWLLLLGRSHTDPHGPLGVRMSGIVGGTLLFLGFLIFLRYPFRARTVGTDGK
ncbi:MAG: MFS transporter [Anaerolineae bacterium]|nr:MFS transporter [Anaerolineae bacterium]